MLLYVGVALLTAYALGGLYFGWLFLGIGEAPGRRDTRSHVRTRLRALKREPQLFAFLIMMAVAGLPIIAISAYRASREDR